MSCNRTDLNGVSPEIGDGVHFYAPWAGLFTLILAALFLPAIGLAHHHDVPKKVRKIWANLVGGRGQDIYGGPSSPVATGLTHTDEDAGSHLSFWGIMSTNMNLRREEARKSWSDGWFRGTMKHKEMERSTSADMLNESLLAPEQKEDELWEEAPELIEGLEDEHSIVFTHALRPGQTKEENSQCWYPSKENLCNGITVRNNDPEVNQLNWAERLISVREGSKIDNLARWLLPDRNEGHPDGARSVQLAQRRCNLYRPLYYQAKDVRWCDNSWHKTYRNCLSKPDLDEPAQEVSSKTNYNRALLAYMPELRAMEQLYSVGVWFSLGLVVLMFPMMCDSMAHDNTDEYFTAQHISYGWHTYLLWRTAWINSAGESHAWKDEYATFVMTVRMCMMAAILVWALFRHSAHDIMVEHPIGMQDFTVEIRDLPVDVSEQQIIEGFEKTDPELQVSKVIFVESSFPSMNRPEAYRSVRAHDGHGVLTAEDGDENSELNIHGAFCVALVSFHTVAMRDQVLMAHHSPSFFGITHISSYRHAKKTGVEIGDQVCRVLPASPPCEMLYECFAWQRTPTLHLLSQNGSLATCLAVIVGTYVLLYFLYCSEFGVNPFNPNNEEFAATKEDSKTLDASILFQGCATLLAVIIAPVMEQVIVGLNTRTRYSAIVSRVIVWATVVGIFYLPAQVLAASSTVFKGLCAADELAIGSLCSFALFTYWLLFPAVVLLRPGVTRIGKVWFWAKYVNKTDATQEELDWAYELRSFDAIEHRYDLLYVMGIARIILGFTPVAMIGCCATLFLTKKAIQYHFRYQSSASVHACGSAAQHVTAVFMFLAVNIMFTMKSSGLFSDGTKMQFYIGATPETLFQGSSETLNYWPMVSLNVEWFVLVISIPEVLLLVLARYGYGWVNFLSMKKDLPRRRLKSMGATYSEFARCCENYDQVRYTSARKKPGERLTPDSSAESSPSLVPGNAPKFQEHSALDGEEGPMIPMTLLIEKEEDRNDQV